MVTTRSDPCNIFFCPQRSFGWRRHMREQKNPVEPIVIGFHSCFLLQRERLIDRSRRHYEIRPRMGGRARCEVVFNRELIYMVTDHRAPRWRRIDAMVSPNARQVGLGPD